MTVSNFCTYNKESEIGFIRYTKDGKVPSLKHMTMSYEEIGPLGNGPKPIADSGLLWVALMHQNGTDEWARANCDMGFPPLRFKFKVIGSVFVDAFIVIDTLKKAWDFFNRFRSGPSYMDTSINWDEVVRHHSDKCGFMVTLDLGFGQDNVRHKVPGFLYTFDCASGVMWKPNEAISRIFAILPPPPWTGVDFLYKHRALLPPPMYKV